MLTKHSYAAVSGRNRLTLWHLAVVFLLACFLYLQPASVQQARGEELPRVGILSFFGKEHDSAWQRLGLQPFRQSLADQGWVEGENVHLEYASANGDPSLFSRGVDELLNRDVDVILAGSAPALRAAFRATGATPIVGADLTTEPIAEGYVQTYARPGKNVTGVFLDAPELAGKWFELLRQVNPALTRVAVLWDPAPGSNHLLAVRSVASSLGITLQILEVREPEDIDTAFASMSKKTQAVVILPSPMNYWQSTRLAELALKYRLPTTSMALDFAKKGGVIAYGPDTVSIFQRSAVLVAKILDGAEPGDIPVERPSKIRLVVNLKTARALGVKIPQSILLRADEVIR